MRGHSNHRGALLLALGLAACGSPVTEPTVRPRAAPPAPRVVAVGPAPERAPSLAERLSAERAEARARGAEVVAEQRVPGDATLHLVLDAGWCYGVFVASEEGAVEVRMLDEHDHELGAGAGDAVARLDDVCPRWSGSFQLSVRVTGATVLLERRRAQPSASYAP